MKKKSKSQVKKVVKGWAVVSDRGAFIEAHKTNEKYHFIRCRG